jgi:DNA-directed RNA polymerase subunit E'/Rpb7
MAVQSLNWSLWHKKVQAVGEQLLNKYSERCTHVVFGLIIAVMLTVGGAELNPGPKVEEKLKD